MTKVRPPATGQRTTSALLLNTPGDRFEQEADRVAEAVVRGEAVRMTSGGSTGRTLQRASDERTGPVIEGERVMSVVRSNGQPLADATKSLMEAGLGFDLSRVRVHTDAEAAGSARAIGARAYTIGSDIVFGAGEYAPRSREGQRLLAHELTHVHQQASAPPMVQRWSFWDELAGLSAGDTFDAKTLDRYLGDLRTKRDIEDHSDSDNKARAIVAAWKKDQTAFALDASLKALLIREMQSGFCGTPDELAILDLLTTASDDELTQMFTAGRLSAADLESDFHFAEDDKLMAFFAKRFEGGYEGAKKKPVVKSGGSDKVTAPDAKVEEKPRRDFVFIMGDTKRDQFYKLAAHYFRLHYPDADLIVSERTLEGVLSHIDHAIEDPIGNLYIVSHGNEDGTLSFGLDDEDMKRDPQNPRGLRGDKRLSPIELREKLNPPGGGPSQLRDVSAKIDGKTTIRIRGCSLGQNQEFVNLIDAAFGGKGQVIASTHEQVYGTSGALSKQARDKAVKAIEDAEPMPPAVDPQIKDPRQKREALVARDKAVRERRARINQKLKDSKQDIDAAAAVAGSWEAMSGVVMQRPGNKKFSEAEVKADIEKRYSHLGKRQQANFIARIVAGQKIDQQKFPTFKGPVPITSAQALIVFAPQLRQASFVHDRKQDVDIETTDQGDGKETKTYTFHDKQGRTLEGTLPDIPADDAAIMREAKVNSPNPQNFTWEVKRSRVGAQLSITVVGTRVFADLHHQSLNVSANEPFTPGEDNPIFYMKSTFDPKDPAKKEPKKGGQKK